MGKSLTFRTLIFDLVASSAFRIFTIDGVPKNAFLTYMFAYYTVIVYYVNMLIQVWKM